MKQFKVIIGIALLSSLCSFAARGNGERDEVAPEIAAKDVHISLRDTPILDKAFIDVSPAERKGTVPVGRLGIDAGNKDMIVKLASEIAENTYGRYDSLLIAHKGKLLFESYYTRGRINLPHGQASATKAYLSLVVGRAIQLGYLTMADLDKPLIHFFKDLDTTNFVKGAEKVTLHHALTMRSGVVIDNETWGALEETPDASKGWGKVQAYFEKSSPIDSQSQIFDYKRVDPSLVVQVVAAVVPGSAKDFIENELLDKLGITTYGWTTDANGLPTGPFGSRMTSRDMIKWGTLVMNKGKWQGEQLISEVFLAKAVHKIIHPGDDTFYLAETVTNPGYGYFWWQADLHVGDQTYFCTSAQGGGGQYILLIEELDLIVVATGHRTAKDPDRIMTTLQLTAERILPAFIP